jgi:hypothetical protein
MGKTLSYEMKAPSMTLGIYKDSLAECQVRYVSQICNELMLDIFEVMRPVANHVAFYCSFQ